MTERPKIIASCHACGGPMDVSAVAPFSNVECPGCGKHTRVKREFGPYTLVRRHAVGGMSMVFAAHDNTLDREVALKILSEEYSADERRIAAFEEEARITASFSHPNVVRVLTTGRAFERFYIAMELVPGGHFEHQINKRGRIPEEDMLPLAIEVAHGLKAAHAAGLIHRDVKPGNILLDAEGHAKLVDFGLALVTQGGKAQATELWATPYYVPPETVEGHPEDFRSDIYAFGATLYHALSGKPPCGEESMATDVLREAKKRVIPLSAADSLISEETCRIVEKAMAYESKSRYASYDEMIADLGAALRDLKSGRSETTASAAQRRAIKKRRERNTVLCGLFAVVAAAGLTVWLVNRRDPETVVVEPPPKEESVTPPVEEVSSADISLIYREARLAVDGKDYNTAVEDFLMIHRNEAVQEPTRTWAGVEAVMACYLDGRTHDARKLAQETHAHLKTLPQEAGYFDGDLSRVLGELARLEPLAAEGGGASGVVSAMLAGLKNWEQGMLEPAAACFQSVVSAELSPDDQWAAMYQKLAGDYLSDYAELSGSLFSEVPAEAAVCEAAIDELNSVLITMKTRGRARFNVRAFQLDIARQMKLIKNGKTAVGVPVVPVAGDTVQVADVMEKLAELSGTCRFHEAVAYLKTLPGDPEGARLDALIMVTQSSAVFLADIEQDLAKEPVTEDMLLKSGDMVSSISVDGSGVVTGMSPDGQSKSYSWGDFSPDALINLHRLFVKNPKSELDRLRRHECAISFDWLAGNRERALGAASVLAEGSESFKKRWDWIVSGLPQLEGLNPSGIPFPE